MNDLSKDAVNRLAVDEAGAGQRVDNFLLRVLKGVPKSHIYRILRSGEVRVNRLRVKPDVRLVLGDELRIPPIRTGLPATGKRKPPPLSASIPILYEDDALIAVDKPAGLAVHGGSGVAFGLIEQMRAARPTAKFLELVHRLDRDTSGVLLLAKKRAALVGLHAALREGRVDKRYQILVKGHWRDPKREVTLPLTKFLTSTGERRVRVEQVGGQSAKTVFYGRRVWTDVDPPVSLLEAELHTGRTHQIRVHLTHLGFALAGDEKYGDFAWNKKLSKQGLKRMFLHARRLAFAHPMEEREVAIEAALPSELSRFLESMGSVPQADA
ncbi:MAG TPA: RluA family pseudouridine synthase [Casimicrobiaceae bacterium]|jgi:23S rRNA pseudouridine955/2504/2580 synthase|nr:RluA family pseudouridine synthase [Casimicrobiaceae bacterium]